VREGNIELSMGKDRHMQVQANMYHRLALRLVDGYGESEMNRELMTGKRDVEVLIFQFLKTSQRCFLYYPE
jgi:hypothetical protein